MYKVTIILVTALATVQVNSHGRLMRPPNRSSLWRVAEFQEFEPPINWNDNELFCGGTHQIAVVGGNCGVCGDPISQSVPRDNEINGKWYRGIIAGRYTSGGFIDVEVELTQQHLGYMEFRLCTTPHVSETQDCFNRHVLQRADDGGTKIIVNKGTGWYKARYLLPDGVSCEHCVIQWNYRAGNTWGDCGDGSGAPGCGAQETFRGCSDIQII